MSTITSILGTDLISNSRTTINTNFQNLNAGKVESSLLTGSYITSSVIAGTYATQASVVAANFAPLVSPSFTTPNIGVATATSINFGGSALSTYTTWTNYTPTVTLQGGTGNTVPVYSTNSGRYLQIGNIVFLEVLLTGDGGAEGAGTGIINVSLPVAAGANQPGNGILVGLAVNNATYFQLLGNLSAGSPVQLQYYTSVTAIANFTGDNQNNTVRVIRLNFFYEV